MQVLIAEPDLGLRSFMFTALNDAGFWLRSMPLDRPVISIPPTRLRPVVLVTDADGGLGGAGPTLAARLRGYWADLGVVYVATVGNALPDPGPRDRVLPRPLVADELIACVRDLAQAGASPGRTSFGRAWRLGFHDGASDGGGSERDHKAERKQQQREPSFRVTKHQAAEAA